jgi:hypothetical protein
MKLDRDLVYKPVVYFFFLNVFLNSLITADIWGWGSFNPSLLASKVIGDIKSVRYNLLLFKLR